MDTRLFSPNHFLQWKNHVTRSLITSLDLSTHCEIHSGHNGPIHTMAVDNLESRYVLTGGNDCKISFYDLNAREKSDLRTLVPSVEDVYKIYPQASTTRSETTGHNFAVSSVEWFPIDLGAFISSSFDEKLNIWDTENMEIAGTFGLHSKIHMATMHPKGIHNIVACGTASAGIRLCDLNTGVFEEN
jgi:DNA excision repair protein ERCC-8